MDLRTWFPINYRVRRRDLSSLLICIVLYLILSAVASLASRILGGLPLVGWLVSLVCWLVGLYCLVGMVLAGVEYFRH